MIQQTDLARYLELQTAARTTESSLGLLRKVLLKQHAAGDETEDGPLQIDVVSTSSIRFSAEAVALVLGTEAAEDLKAQIEPTISQSIKISENPEYVAPKARAARSASNRKVAGKRAG